MGGAATTNTGAPTGSPYTTQQAPQFTGTPPKPTPYGDFTAPDPSTLANDPYTQFRLAEGQRGMERSAAARGTLLSGGLLRSLERYRQGVASEEAGNAFNRALSAYTTNRDTNQQNFGQNQTVFGDQLAGFNANTEAGLGYGKLDFEKQQYADSQAELARQRLLDQNERDNAMNAERQRQAQGQSDASYAAQVEAARQQNVGRVPMPGTTAAPIGRFQRPMGVTNRGYLG
jgi:hypothetical protein